MESYTYSPEFETFSIVDSSTKLKKSVIFHGTSAMYSEQIQTEGLKAGYLPMSHKSLEDVKVFLEKLPDFLSKIPDILEIIGVLNNYLENVHSISTTLIGYAAVKYATSPAKGGQILMYLLDSIRKIAKILEKLPDTTENREQLISDFLRISSPVEELCSQIKNADGVIYLIEVQAQMLGSMKISDLSVLSTKSIPLERITGKITIPASTQFDDSYAEAIRKVFKEIEHTPKTIGHAINKDFLQRPVDDDDNDALIPL